MPDPARDTQYRTFIKTTAVRALCTEPAHDTPMAVCLIQPTAVTTLYSDPTLDTPMGCMLDPDHSHDSVVHGS
jgi:hypothetical protein